MNDERSFSNQGFEKHNHYSFFSFKFSLFINYKNGGLAQLGERLPCKQEVSGSNPLISTRWRIGGERRPRTPEKMGQ